MDNRSYRPKLRPVDSQWIDHAGQPALVLQDRLGLSGRAVVVPRTLVPLLSLCDGTRDIPTLRVAMELHTGIRLEPSLIERVLAQLDDTLMLDNEHFAEAYRQAQADYRAAPFRQPLLAGSGYPSEPSKLGALLDGWLTEAAAHRDGRLPPGQLPRGVICPHIDYDRGGPIYAQLWDAAREAVAQADLFIVLGTDHGGSPAEVTLTRQSYQTPFGVLPTDLEAVDQVAEAMGPEVAFRSELNHRVEHSVELAAVWLHHLVGGRTVRMLPVLCGSFHPFTEGDGRPSLDERWRTAAAALRGVAESNRTLVIAAADLAHMGPAFGDRDPMGAVERATLASFDTEMLAAVCRGDAEGFLDLLRRERDRWKVCGLPPIYLALHILGQVQGEVVAYSQCPAPAESVVSVAGVLLNGTG